MAARVSWLNIALRMLGLALLLGWLSVYAIPLLQRAGVSERSADRLPFLGFLLGLGLGLASARSQTLKGLLSYALLVPVCGGVFWFFGVLLGGLLVALGLSPDAADYAPIAGFCLGLCVALLPGAVVAWEKTGSFFSRSRARSRRESKR